MKRTILWGLTALLLLSGCQPFGTISSPTATASPTTPPETATPFSLATATQTSIPPTTTPTEIPRPIIERVLIITVDGLRPDPITYDGLMPNLRSLMEKGVYSLEAQTIFPSSTLPAHASLISGMCPDKHGVDWNDYLPDSGYANAPTLFDIAHEAGLRTVMIVGKEKLQQITNPDSVDRFLFINDRDSVIAEAAAPIIAEGFGLMLIHLPLVDILGHEYGWMSSNYLVGTFRADEAIGMILTALDEAGLREGTLIIITADHGGDMEFKHGGKHPAAMTIPWVLSEASLNPGAIQRPIGIVDTAATAAYALNLRIPSIWDGIPAYEAFGEIPPTRVELPCQ